MPRFAPVPNRTEPECNIEAPLRGWGVRTGLGNPEYRCDTVGHGHPDVASHVSVFAPHLKPVFLDCARAIVARLLGPGAFLAMPIILKRAFRHSTLWLISFLPTEQRRRLERQFRGWEEAEKLAAADIVVISFGKSGRTWLRVMMSRHYQLAYGLDKEELLGFDNLHRKNPEIPSILFTHDNYLKDYTGNADSKVDYLGKRVVLLVRNPRDVSVSQFFQWKHRMRRGKKVLNRYPNHGSDISTFEFVMDELAGLPKVIRFLNLWAEEAPKFEHLHIVRYEDMRADPVTEFSKVISFLGGAVDDDAIRAAVEYSSVENMRKLEEKNDSRLGSGRMKPGKKGVQDSYKVRRAKVGGYRDYFSDEEVEKVDDLVGSTLTSFYGYGKDGGPTEQAAAS